jgi:outer membrane protein TolC
LISCRSIISMFLTYATIIINMPCFADILIYHDAVVDSLHHSANLRAKMEDMHISDAQFRGNYARLYPEISFGGRAERYENLDQRNNQGIDTIGNEIVGGNQSAWRSSMYFSGQYYISHWYKKRFEAAYYEKLRDSSLHECETEAKKTIRDVTDTFSGISEGKIKLKYSTEILHRLYEISKLKREAFALGQFAYEDILKAESDAITVEKEISKTRKEIKEYLEKLSNYTGKKYSEDMEVSQLSSSGKAAIADDAITVGGTPEYKARQKELEAIRFKEKSARNNFLPDISVYGRYDFYNSNPASMDAALRDVRQTAYNIGVMITIPLFDGGVRQWERQKNLYEIRKQEENVRATFDERNRNIKTLQVGYNELFRSYHHYQKLNNQYEKMLEINNKAFGLGERSRLDTMELEKDALTVKKDLVVVENSVAVYEKQMFLELDYHRFVSEYDGDWACKY